MDVFRTRRGEIIFYRKEIQTLKVRRDEALTEMAQTGGMKNTELVTTIIGLDDMTRQVYTTLIKKYEEMIAALEMIANIPVEERLTRGSDST